MQLQQRARVIAVIGTIWLLLAAVFVVTQLQKRLAPDDSSASAQNALQVEKISGPTGALAVGNKFKVALKPDIKSSPAPSIAEIFVNFDHTSVKVLSVVGGSGGNLITLNTADNGNWSKGIATADVAATGGSTFTSGQTLAEIEFEVIALKGPTTRILIAQSTNLGLPNTMAAGGYGTLDIPLAFSPATSSATSSAVSSVKPSSTPTSTATSTATQTSTAGAKSNELQLKLTTPAYSKRNVGDRFTVGVAPILRSSQSAKVAEVVINYNRNLVRFISASPASGMIAVNQVNNSSTGKFTIDLATQGGTNFVSTAIILQVQFEVTNASSSSTALGIDSSSTLGAPDTLATNGYGSLTIPLGGGQSSAPSSSGQTSTANTATNTSANTNTNTATITSSAGSSQGATTSTLSSDGFSSSATSTFSFTFSTPSSETSSTFSGFPISSTSSDGFTPTTSATSTVTISPKPSTSLFGLDPRAIIFLLFGLSAASGITAGYLFLKKRKRDEERNAPMGDSLTP